MSARFLLAMAFGLLLSGRVSAAVFYVDVNSTNPVPPYATWGTASTDIQSAIDASSDGDLVLVNDGVYQTGGRVVYGTATNRVVINKAVKVQSVNGSTATVIQGSGLTYADAIRCVYLTNSACLIGFTLTNGCSAQDDGGGAYCESTNSLVANCLLVQNATYSAGGAVYGGTLSNCTILGNVARYMEGGGAINSLLINCLIGSNSVSGYGGGVSYSTLTNCVLMANSASDGGGAAYESTLSWCTLAGNSTSSSSGEGGGALNCTLNNCVITNNSAYEGGGVSGDVVKPYSSVLNNCLIVSNLAVNSGGGAYRVALNNCQVNGNSITNYDGYGAGVAWSGVTNCLIAGNSIVPWGYGAGAYQTTLNNCAILGNTVVDSNGDSAGGGVEDCTVINSTLNSNSSNTGGGADSSTLNNCVLSGNTAWNGGGANFSTLNDCLVVSNTATGAALNPNARAGGVSGGVMTNCTVVGNSETAPNISTAYHNVGGEGNAVSVNCIIYANYALSNNYANYVPYYFEHENFMTNCCTFPLPTNGTGNISNAPLFVNYIAGNFRLQTNSPCINAGANPLVSGSFDLDGRPRIVGGTVDMGAYEFQGAGVGEFTGWLQQYGLPVDGSADYVDSDDTGMNNWQKWIAGLNPTNPASVLAMVTPVLSSNPTGLTVTWQSVNTRTYYLQSGTNLSGQPAFFPLQSNIVGEAGTTSYTDTTATNGGPYFYRVGVQ